MDAASETMGRTVTEMCDTCGDNRFELIEKYKQKLLDATNIEDSPEEMAVIDNILFRFWQMGWLKGELFGISEQLDYCSDCVNHGGDWDCDHVHCRKGMDTISRRAAIDAICNACGKIDCDKMDKCEKLQLPPANCSEFPNNSDTISRQAAIDALNAMLNAFKKVRDNLPEDKREEYTDSFCKLTGKMYDELGKEE